MPSLSRGPRQPPKLRRSGISLTATGYRPLRSYAAIGDGRTVALVADDGSIDWLCIPDLDSPSVFGAILDSARGGRFELRPEIPFDVERSYVSDTNVLQTTFITDRGRVRVTDAMTLPSGLAPGRELVRRIEGLSGRVPLRWSVEPRFGYSSRTGRLERRLGFPVAIAGRDAMAICPSSAGEWECRHGRVGARFEAAEGARAQIVLSISHQEPLVFPPQQEVDERLESTIAFWRHWAGSRTYDGPWREAVTRSALALKLLVFAPSGAIAAAATTSLPEALGGERNWDYRYSWVRDSAFTLEAFLRLGCPAEAEAFFWWLMHASQLTHPILQVLYRLGGGVSAPERALDLDGYCGSKPVRVGNAAAGQTQLDVYGDVFQTAWLYACAGDELDQDIGRRLADIADLVCAIWRQPDSGIWEVRSDPVHFIHSKMMCWVALDRASKLARSGHIPDRRLKLWERELEAIRTFVEGHGWSEARQSYVRSAGSTDLDASLLMAVLLGYDDPSSQRLQATVRAIRTELGNGPLLYRYSGEDGLSGSEGFFLTCSFWLVDALARLGHIDEAAESMDALLAFSNDVGLYAEEVEPETGAFLGNFPQGLVHLALINAAASISEQQRR
jgi:GH15 family glucan-1,4-alpha-glucosidase